MRAQSMDIIRLLLSCIFGLWTQLTNANDSFKLVTLGGQKPAVNQQKGQIWRGDIYPANALLDALKTVAAGGEVILVTDARLEAVAHTHSSLAHLGLHNMLWHSPDEERCHRAEVLFPELSCVWSSQPLPTRLLPPQRMSLKRAMLLARIVRLGYNVLSIDADTLALRDPYPYLKTPPLKDKNLIIMRGSRGTLSPGIMYVQNAHRHGPVAWALAEAAMRNLHWADAGVSVPSAAGLVMPDAGGSERGSVTCELSCVLMDTLVSTMARKATHWQCFRPSVPATAGSAPSKAAVEAAAATWDKQHLAALGLAEGGSLRDLFQREVVRVKPQQEPELVRLMSAASYTLLWASLGIPSDPAAVLVPLPPEAQAALMLGSPVLGNSTRATAAPGNGAGSAAAGGSTQASSNGGGTATAAVFQQLLANDRGELRRRLLAGEPSWLGHQSPSLRIRATGGGNTTAGHLMSSKAGNNTSQSTLHNDDVHPSEGVPAQAAEALEGNQWWERHGRRARSLQQQAQVWSTGHGIEQFAFAPDWLFGTWLARGLYGFWDPRTSGHPPRQVLGHMSRVPGHTAGKDTLRMATGTFNWTVASRLQSSIAAALHSSLHSQNASKGVGAGVSASNASSAGAHSFLPRMVALSPESPLLALAKTRAEWAGIVQGLAQVAALSGRMMIWPDPVCSSPWIQPQPVPRGKLPLQPNHAFLPHGPLESLRCTPATILSPHCLYDRSAPGGAWQWWRTNQAGASDSLAEHLRWRAGSTGAKRSGAAGGAAARKQVTQRQQKHQQQKIGSKGGKRQLHAWQTGSTQLQEVATNHSASLWGDDLGHSGPAHHAPHVSRQLMSGSSDGAAGPATAPHVLRGMLWLEFEHVSQLLPQDFRSPWAANTLRVQPGAGQAAIQKGMMEAPHQRPLHHRHLSSSSQSQPAAGHQHSAVVVDLTAEDVLVELAKVNHQPVVYLTQHVRVQLPGEAQAAYQAFQQGCKGLWGSDLAP